MMPATPGAVVVYRFEDGAVIERLLTVEAMIGVLPKNTFDRVQGKIQLNESLLPGFARSRESLDAAGRTLCIQHEDIEIAGWNDFNGDTSIAHEEMLRPLRIHGKPPSHSIAYSSFTTTTHMDYPEPSSREPACPMDDDM